MIRSNRSPTATTETLAGTPYATSASYNDAGELTAQIYPNGDTLTTSYDPSSGWAIGESVQLSGSQSATSLLANESYSGAAGAMGLLTGASLGAFTGGSGAYAASYDRLGRVTSSATTYTPSGGSVTTLYQTQPTYDALGNVIEATTTLPTGVDTQVFCYDDLARLTWAGSSGTPACSGAPTPGDTGSLAGTSAPYSASYSYDSLNRLTAAPLGSYTYGDSAHADAATSIGSAWSASYDAAGNMTCRAASSATTCAGSSPTGAALSYDNEGRLAAWQNTPGSSPTQSVAYLYDGAGQRVQQAATSSGATTTTSYIGALEEVSSSGGTTTTTAYYGGLAESVNGTLSYLLSDGLGSISEAVSTTTGAVTATQLYGPYGSVRSQSGTLPTSKGYTGQISDTTTSGLDYYGARYYDPVAGQFTSADTLLPQSVAQPDPGQLNRYAYVAGNPESRADPTGHRLGPLGDYFFLPSVVMVAGGSALVAAGQATVAGRAVKNIKTVNNTLRNKYKLEWSDSSPDSVISDAVDLSGTTAVKASYSDSEALAAATEQLGKSSKWLRHLGIGSAVVAGIGVGIDAYLSYQTYSEQHPGDTKGALAYAGAHAVASAVGGYVGAALGAAGGAALGTLACGGVPICGVVGYYVGSAVGGWVGASLADMAVDAFANVNNPANSAVANVASTVSGFFGSL